MKRTYFDLFSKANGQTGLIFANQTLTGTDNDDIIIGGEGDDVIEGSGGADKLDGGGGNNTLSYASSPASVYVFLISNYAFGGDAEGDEIKNFSNLIGSQYNDVLVGSWDDNLISGGNGHDIIYGYGGVNFLSGGAGNDVIYSGAGGDIIDGGAGSDMISYALSGAGVQVNLSGFEHSGGAATGDVLFHMEHLQGSQFQDNLTGTIGANIIHGLAGNDHIYGAGGDDDIRGDSGNDIIEGGSGADRLDGGAGFDTLSYRSSSSHVTVNLTNSSAKGGHASGDHIRDFESIWGTDFNDTLIGNSGRNTLLGYAGDDIIYGRSGNDVVEGGSGEDRLDGGAGFDTLSYRASATSVNISLEDGRVYGGDAEGDSIANFENIAGSDFDDQLTGDAGANRIWGYEGDDFITATAGSDMIDGGDGNDLLNYYFSASGITLNLATNSALDGIGAHDSLFNIEAVYGSQFNDHITGDETDNRLESFAGDDKIYGGAGDDYLFGLDGDDEIYGGADNDFILGYEGAEILDGGSGIDTLSYERSSSAVRVNLAENTASGGQAEGDRISHFENLTGSFHSDILTGDAGDNILRGLSSDDILAGGSGRDTLYGGDGADTLYGGEGADIFVLSYDYTADIVKDFVDGIDKIGLDDTLTFEGLTITTANGHTSIADKYDGTIYMIIETIAATDITEDDFVVTELV